MAQTAVDLPDPLGGSKTDTGAAFKSADDLLAQLAGDEVDRLLSEADASTPGPLNVDLAVNVDPSEPIELTPVSEAEAQINDGLSSEEAAGINELFKLGSQDQDSPGDAASPVAAGAVDAAPVEKVKAAAADDPSAQNQRATAESILQKPAEQPPSAAEALAKEMEEDEQAHAAALARMKQPATSPEPIAAPAKVTGDQTQPAAPEAAVSALAATPVPATNAAEIETVAEAPTAVIDEDEVDLDAEPAEEFQTPLLVRVLEWINAPLSGLSDGAREAVGKVALVTTLNAVAVLTYVLLFRRHH